MFIHKFISQSPHCCKFWNCRWLWSTAPLVISRNKSTFHQKVNSGNEMMVYRGIIDNLKKYIGWENGNNKEKFTVCIEGNIASGKTTLLEYFESEPMCEVMLEPMTKWRNFKGHNVLGLMYEDPKRWALTFQTYVQLTMLQAHCKPYLNKIKLMERSIFSAKYCFVENLYQNKVMPEIEYHILTEWFDYILESQKFDVDLIVYLRTKPDTVLERIRTRGRDEEQSISKEYLETLHDLHEDWLVRKKFPLPCNVLILDAEGSLLEMSKTYEKYRSDILHP